MAHITLPLNVQLMHRWRLW